MFAGGFALPIVIVRIQFHTFVFDIFNKFERSCSDGRVSLSVKARDIHNTGIRIAHAVRKRRIGFASRYLKRETVCLDGIDFQFPVRTCLQRTGAFKGRLDRFRVAGLTVLEGDPVFEDNRPGHSIL